MLWLFLLLVPFASLNEIIDDKTNSTSICNVVLDPNSTLAQIESLNVTGIVENRSDLFDFCMEERMRLNETLTNITNETLSNIIVGENKSQPSVSIDHFPHLRNLSYECKFPKKLYMKKDSRVQKGNQDYFIEDWNHSIKDISVTNTVTSFLQTQRWIRRFQKS